MKMIAEYLENAHKFEQLAAHETNPELKASVENQASTYRKLAMERAKKLGIAAQKLPPQFPGTLFPAWQFYLHAEIFF